MKTLIGKALAFIVVIVALISLTNQTSIDLSSYSNIDQIKQSNIAFYFFIDFERQL